jgi:hydrogenase-1 operon protein HyaF
MNTDNVARSLADIAVRVEHSSGNIEPLLHQVRHALSLLLNVGATTCIDLKGIPLAPGEEERIMAALGTGEVRAQMTAAGTSEIVETGFPGVWLVSHFGEQHELQGRFIEITAIPEILRSQSSDIEEGLEVLKKRLGTR